MENAYTSIRQKGSIALSLLCCLLLLGTQAWAQGSTARQVRGTVVDAESKDPLPGVAVLIVGTSTGVVTNLDGEYTLEVPSDAAVLEFSYLGYQNQRQPVGSRSVIDVSLQVAEEQLQEVVVIGYGTVRKSDLTGAVTSVRGEELTKMPAANPVQALQGKVSGLQVSNTGNPGDAPVVRLRGVGTLGNDQALFVVDGVILDNINFLNSSDIASVEVLKDASAVAIFGSRGANGVIIITTKKGRVGEAPRINLRAEYGFENVANRLDLMTGRQFATYVNAITPGTYNNLDVLPNIDWQDRIFTQNAPVQNYNLSFVGASDKLNYYIGGGYFAQEGILPKSDYSRISFKSNTTYRIRDFLRLGADLTASVENKQNPPGVVGLAYRAWPINDPFLPNGDFAEVQGGNALAAIAYHNNDSRILRGVANFFGEADLIKGLTFRTSYQLDGALFRNQGFTPEYFVSPVQQSAFSQLSKTNAENLTWIWENTLNFSRDFGEKHRIDAVVGYTAQEFYGESLFGARRNLLREDPDFWYLDAGEQEGQNLGNNASTWTMVSYLGRINYSLLDRYLFTATFRRDYSSRFGRENRYGDFPSFALGWNVHNEPFFPNTPLLNTLKLRASWGIIGNDKIDYNARFSTVSTGLGAVFGQNPNLEPGSALTRIGNPTLQWEDTQQLDIGAEWSMLEGRLRAEVDYYKKNTKGILVPLAIPATSGGGVGASRFFNAAEVLNRGIEFNLGWEDEIGDLRYNLGVLGSTIHNEVLSLGASLGQDSVIIAGSLGNGQTVTRTVAGRSIGFYYGYQTAGVFQNQEQLNSLPRTSQQGVGDLIFVDTNNDGRITEADRVELGSWIPDFTYGFSAGAGYKGVNLSLDFFGQWGNKIYNGKQAVRFELLNFESRFADFWTGEGSTNEIPRASAGGVNYSVSDFFLEDASFLRLRTATISYDLAASLLERYQIGSAQLYVRGTNLWTRTPYSGYLPDIPVGSPLNGAIDLGVYPLTRSIMFGLNVSF
ncbi:SusC/RagA family TonB-linked outer membrane protein [Cesiribacter andamanensis]|uniref:Outer membrane cobalamin receptor protein n=1 Tax=Cesiribacter andamanensis AMV16 TaxID=1279009 RepID=M7N2V8_9BACT|nr:TonB-dependent receptor [Cesiribacter andamanensis]EMR03013.1 Outer membrane cobalamin receptor protein [Cesiribacter andamanensis AMV16]